MKLIKKIMDYKESKDDDFSWTKEQNRKKTNKTKKENQCDQPS